MKLKRPAAMTEIAPRARVAVLPEGKAADGADVVAGLTARPKTLPAQYFYDAAGSALFERITALPEYYLTRTEIEILGTASPAIAAATGPVEIVELGSGDDRKARLLLSAYAGAGAARDGASIHYVPIDVSGAALRASAIELAETIPGLTIVAVQGTFDAALNALAPAAGRRMITFLGSTMGNLDPAETTALLAAVRHAVAPDGYFLIGLDLRKDKALIEAAYNDRAGITAAFNRNILRVLNRRFRGDFAPERFVHRAFYREPQHQIEMHLFSPVAQRARLEDLDLTVEIGAGESIRTEISRKFDLDAFAGMARDLGFREVARHTDGQARFGLLLLRADAPP